MGFLHLLEQIRFPVLDKLMLLITHLGEETAFLVAALIVFWCVDKYQGYYVLGVGLFGNMVNQFMKISCRVLRPWHQDATLNPLEAALPEADGYSFPSGHSQTAVGYMGCVAVTRKNKILRVLCITGMILVPFSRMYVGVHTPADVLVGGGMALVMIFALKPVLLGNKKNIPWFFGVMLILNAAYLLYVHLYNFPADLQIKNYQSALKNGYTFLGCFAGVLAVYVLDEKKFHFGTDAVWWAQILKALLGLVAVLIVKEGTKPLLELMLPVYPARAVRYFLVVIMAGVIWPMTFRWFGKLGRKKV